jgi:nicotinamidase-related amidase
MAERWRNTALLVIDMQNDFIEEGAVTQVKGGKSIVPNVIRVVELARQRGILVIWVFSPFLLSFSRHGVVTCLRNLEKFWN